ncbi:AAA family ATPase [Amycolatopsis palatopharyngis]|uniref:AAA family ATPase n=1 Tax=Amycolatopsis palatopharyngis TaxID=187982 RepID=UPI000E2522B9|nr:AAA family ATPase [Amycolatopsis palatopharyngis]
MVYVQHLSVRVPWHDNGWDGSVCRDPLGNSSCLLLKNIGENRRDEFEVANAGIPIADLPADSVPCVAERSTFLSAHAQLVTKKHPYRWTSALQGIEEKAIHVPPWSVAVSPYFWLHRANLNEGVLPYFKVDDYSADAEQEAIEALGFEPPWVLHGDNQQAAMTEFFRDVHKGQSLVFFYLKHSPFEDAGKILVGAATVADLRLPGRWPGNTAFPNHMWETALSHTLRPDGTDGILLPLQELAALAETGTDVSTALPVAPEQHREFSYVTEHVSDDIAVAALLELRRAADAAVELGVNVPASAVTWLDTQLGLTWRRRGPSPGLPAVLPQLGWAHPTFAAHTIAGATPDGGDPWDVLVAALEDRPAPDIVRYLATEPRRRIWRSLDAKTKRLLRLLARFELTKDEVGRVIDRTTAIPIEYTDLLRNPYLLVTSTVDGAAPIPFTVVDRGCFPEPALAARHPLPIDESFADVIDPRRIEAALTWVIAAAEADGHTLLPVSQAIERVRGLAVAQPFDLTPTVLTGLGLAPDDLDNDPDPDKAPLARTTLADSSPAYKLRSAIIRGFSITEFLDYLHKLGRHNVPSDLSAGIDEILGPIHADDHQEQRAREEKRAALAEMYASRVTLLNGRAGTGKTTLVEALVKRPEIQRKGVLLLAPTGKAAVQLTKKAKSPAQTLASFLGRTKRYDGETGRYLALGDDARKAPRVGTVIVDEASMLTEDMLDALLDALHPPDRLVLVGDPRQLPPIGAGRPFVDLERAARVDHDGSWPRVAPGWGELTVLNRQRGDVRDDLMLAQWFSGDEISDGEEEVWDRLRGGITMPTLAAVPWQGRTIANVMDDVLRDELDVVTDDEGRSFARSYGATVDKWVSYREAPGKCENWQILSPVRGRAHGTVQLNRHLKLTHREFELKKATSRYRSVPKPLGSEQIVLGDKVVNLANQMLKSWAPGQQGRTRSYVANGEIGVVIGQLAGKGKKAPWETQVEFSTQPGTRITMNNAVSDDDASVELAWALTVHKAQGSEFGRVFLVVPSGTRALSRELLYTALTRQTDRIVLCHEGPLDDLIMLTRATGSDTARRFTDLVRPADPRPAVSPDGHDLGILDASLVHLTSNGVLVRSKNEVIIAEILNELARSSWFYEKRLTGSDGRVRLPDFTIEAPDGRTVYWEHLGLLHDPKYRHGWEKKKAWYAGQGILPLQEGGGENGSLVWTDDRSGVDVPGWRALAESFLSAGPRRPKRRRIGGG